MHSYPGIHICYYASSTVHHCLCRQAHPETRAAWLEVKEAVTKSDPILGSVMVPECVYRGFCPEFNSCGYVNTEEYRRQLEEYRRKEVADGREHS